MPDSADRTAAPATAADILALGKAFSAAKVLLSATELGVFTALADEPGTAVDLTRRLSLHPRGVRDFLDSLVALGLLERVDDRYRNAPAAQRHLVRGRPEYVGGFLERVNHALYPAWGGLTEVLRTGLPRSGAQPSFDAMTRDDDQRRAYLAMMDAASGHAAEALSEIISWEDHASLLDVGGARGNLVARVLSAHPHLTGTVFDLPQMETSFGEHMVRHGVDGRATFRGGDFFADPLPGADVAVVGHVLHNWPVERRRELIRKAAGAVGPGGLVLVYDPMLDEKAAGIDNLLISLDMLLVTEGGSEYTATECRSWMEEAGLRDVSVHPLDRNETLVVGRRP
ncbi:methyltransferase [Actinoallomurus iriomotensis]|uniref:O-methyltransferase n=1 Tax=Actinoallomurus iriomotensis TaxID=478107 RepID=A0A9W6RKD9_9ACTN|nr:methyltransferase [Actinoallomurus iriomotensis]GLY75490.1 O-methyltransferase [Actinoallomurus iriomotensis]